MTDYASAVEGFFLFALASLFALIRFCSALHAGLCGRTAELHPASAHSDEQYRTV